MAKLSTSSVFGDLLVDGTIFGNVTGNLTGNASTATSATTANSAATLTTARNIALGGVLSGSASFNGSANVTINASIAKPPKSGDWWSGGMPIIGTDGVMEVGKYIDFHNSDTSSNDYDVRLQSNTAGPILLTLPTSTGTIARTADNVASATKLQTVRSINGTNFDGTANITTANWGTARTITIGNAGKSVNGSGNVAWSTAEILGSPTVLGKETDWNTINTTGVYEASGFNESGATGANRPVGAYSWGGLLTLRHKNVTNQVYLSHGSNQMWIRGGWNGSWNTSWAQVYTTQYKPTPADIGAATSSHGTHVTYSTSTPAANGTASAGSAANVSRGDHVHPLQTTISGNAGSATKWATARTLTIGNTGKSVDGTANVSWSLAEIGALPAAGGTLTGDVTVSTDSKIQWNRNTDYARISFKNTEDGDTDSYMYFLTGDNGNEYFKFSTVSGSTTTDLFTIKSDHIRYKNNVVYHAGNKPTPADIGAAAASHGSHISFSTVTPKVAGTAAVGSDSGAARGDHVHPLQTSVSGNAGTATTLQTARTLTIGNTGKTFNGGANVSWSLAEIGAAASSHSHNVITSRGNVTAETGITGRPAVSGLSMSQVYNNGYPTPYGNVISLRGTGDGQILVGWSGTDGAHAPVYVRNKRDNTSTADWSGWAQFYTTAHKPTPADIGAAASSHGTHVTFGTAAPKVAGTAAVGSSSNVAREDHVHPLQTSVSGNAGTATTLQTARELKIGNTGKNFNGSANLSWTLSEIGAAAAADAAQAWNAVIKCATWSRLFLFDGTGTVGGSYLVNIRGTRANIVHNATFIANFSHSSKCNITQINNTSYSNFKVRAVVASGSGQGYFEMYDNANSATNATTQTINVTVTRVSGGVTLTKYTAFTDGTTIPSGYTAVSELTTVSGSYYSGKAATAANAEVLTTARNIQIGNKTVSFNGSANIGYTLAEIGALPTAGGTMTGNIKFADVTSTTYPAKSAMLTWNGSTDGADIYYQVDASDQGRLVLNTRDDANCIIAFAQGGTIKSTVDNSGNFSGKAATSGNADKLATPRTITVNGIVKGSTSFDGSANVTITTSANDITAINKSLTVGTDWMDTGITGSNLSTGTYAVQMFANCQGTGGLWTEYFSGIMSWYASGVNSTEADEIVLHKAGHAPNGQHIYLRTKRNTQGSLVLQIAAKTAITAAINFEFKFKKLI